MARPTDPGPDASASKILDGRPLWRTSMPPGGWAPPWPQCMELAAALPADRWALVGGLMVQLHAAVAGMTFTRPTRDIDIVLHVETGAVTAGQARAALEALGYELQTSLDDAAPAHRFVRGDDQVDVMIADHVAKKPLPLLGRRKMFQVPAGTQALQRTVYCRIDIGGGESVTLSMPNTLGALVLKGAAYREDSRDGGRHLDDAAVLASTMKDPLAVVPQMKGHDRSRIITLEKALADPQHPSWLMHEEADRTAGRDTLRILAANPQDYLRPRRRLGRKPSGDRSSRRSLEPGRTRE